MKIFLYKSLLVFFLVLILFKLTIDQMVSKYEKKIDQFSNKEFLASIKNKIREEIKSGLEKDKILNPEDALLINEFIKKIQKEISEAEK
tara:strand:- start:1350 stop:1616 length:267 start_codon:yes stop_codon:yes gene_type:complete